MNITITGGTGFVGRAVRAHLEASGHRVTVLSRSGAGSWDPLTGPPPESSLAEADAIVHLAGEPIAQRWTQAAKQRIWESRSTGTRNLVYGLSTLSRRPKVLVSASGVGIYGDRGDEVLTESSKPGKGFLPEVAVEWERQANLAASLGVRVVTLRIGMVLGPGGALAKMLPVFRFGMGGVLGKGSQWMSWITLEDLARLIAVSIERESLTGPVNAVAPGVVTNRLFTAALGGAVRRPAVLPVPSFAVRLMFGEMASVVLESQRAVPEKALGAGFSFQHPELRAALDSVLA
jgi:uncharacterized protein (TIGR01777 family)